MRRPCHLFKRRRLLFGVLLLTCGAIVNIAVAWTCVQLKAAGVTRSGRWGGNVTTAREQATLQRAGYWEIPANPGVDDQMRAFSLRWLGAEQTHFILGANMGANFSSAKPTAIRKRSGLPWLSMEILSPGIAASPLSRPPAPSGGAGGKNQPSGHEASVRLPRPLWPGFALNTLFYAAILWGAFAAQFALRRFRRASRIRRGLCPTCAYQVGESPICTECGMPLTPPGRRGNLPPTAG